MGRLKGLPPRLKPAPRVLGHADRQEAQRARDRMRAAGNSLRKLYSTRRGAICVL